MKKEGIKVYANYIKKNQTELDCKEPSFYQVVIYKDEYTPMDFVLEILEKFFFMHRLKATQVMLHAHISGKAVCGVFTKEVAEIKIALVTEYAHAFDYPLTCSMEAAA